MVFVEAALVVVLLVAAVYAYIKHCHQYWRRRQFNFLVPAVPFGNLESPRRRTESIGFHIKNLYMEVKSRGWRHCGLYFFFRPVYLITDLDLLKNAMTRDFDFFSDRGMYYNEKHDPISAHLFAVGGERWRSLRTNLSPTFTAGKMRMLFPTLIGCADLLLDTMRTHPPLCLDMKEILGRFMTDIIGACAFGLDFNAIKEDDSPFRIYGKKVFESSRLRGFKMQLASNFPKLARLIGVTQVTKDVSEFFTKIVQETIEYRLNNSVRRPDFMQMLIDLMKEGVLTKDQVVAQAFIFFLAGFETSSTTMTFTLYELAKDQAIQEKVRNEIEKALEKTRGEITYDAVNEMKYLDQVIDEGLRKYPPVPFVTRTCVKDYTLPDVVIEKGIRLIIPILAIHYDPENYPDPERFDPERFSAQNKANRHSYAHIPFGEGPRICIGMRFGLMQTKIGLAALLQKYKFRVNSRTIEPIQMAKKAFVLNAEGGIWLDAEKIKQE